MSKRNLYARRQLQSLQKRNSERNPNIDIILDFKRSYEDSENLAGYVSFRENIHNIAPDVCDWEWTEEQIKRACVMSGISRDSILSGEHDAHENITIHINHRRYY